MARDVQLKKVYAWEKLAYPGYWTDGLLTREGVRALIWKVHQDVRDAGGVACEPRLIDIKFTKRKRGSACASWGSFNFNPTCMPVCLVLHEIAHSLTWGTPDLPRRDAEGHGARYVACMIALLEHYAGRPAEPAIKLAGWFEMAGPPRRGALKGIETRPDGRKFAVYEAIQTTRQTSVSISAVALQYWRGIFAASSAAQRRQGA